MLCQQLTHCTNELSSRVNLKELRPPLGTPLVNPSQAIGDLCRSLANQRLSLLVAAGDVNDRESIAEGFSSYTVVWQEEQVGLMDLVWKPPRQISAVVCAFEQVESQSLACCSVTLAAAERFLMPVPFSIFWGCNKCPEGEQIASYLPPSRSARYSNSPISLKHSEATGLGSCPVVLRSNKRLVGPVSTPAAKRTAVCSSHRQSSSEFCAISIMVWARGPGILWRPAVCPASSIALFNSSASIAYQQHAHFFLNYLASL